MSDNVREVDRSGFEQLIVGTEPVLVDFWAEWCGPCRAMAPVLDDLAGKFAGRIVVAKVNVDQEPALASSYSVMSIPTLILYRDGQMVERFSGYMTADVLGTKLEKLL